MFCNFAMEILQIEKVVVFLKHDKQLSSKGELLIPEATDSMIVYHANSLHHGITNCISTKMKPLFFRSLLKSSEIFVFEGTSVHVFQRFCFGFPSTKLQRYESKVPNPFCTILNAFAFFTAD